MVFLWYLITQCSGAAIGRVNVKRQLGTILASKIIPPITFKNGFHMKQIFLSIAAVLCMAFAQSCTTAAASAPVERAIAPIERTIAPNVSISDKSIYIVHADAEFILRFDQRVTYEMNGAEPVTMPAQVFMMNGGEWVATWNVDNYVRVNTTSGITNAYIAGQLYIGICGYMTD